MEPNIPQNKNKPNTPAPKPKGPWETIGRSVLMYFGLAILFGIFAFTFFFPQDEGEKVEFSALIQDVRQEEVQKIEV